MTHLLKHHRERFAKIERIPLIPNMELCSSDTYWEQAVDFAFSNQEPLCFLQGLAIYRNPYNGTFQDKRGDLIWKKPLRSYD